MTFSNYYHSLVPKLSHRPKWKPHPCEATISHPLPQPLVSADPLSASVDLPVLGVSYKWNHTLYVLLWLATFTPLPNVFKFLPYFVGGLVLHPFVWLKDTPLSNWNLNHQIRSTFPSWPHTFWSHSEAEVQAGEGSAGALGVMGFSWFLMLLEPLSRSRLCLNRFQRIYLFLFILSS